MPEQTQEQSTRRAGRPSLHGGEGESPVFRLRIDPSQLVKVRAVAAERGVTVSALVRQALAEIVG